MPTVKIEINEQKKDQLVGHNGIYKALGAHSPEELVKLGIIARESHDATIMSMFKTLPNKAQLLELKTSQELAAIEADSSPAPSPTITPAPAVSTALSVIAGALDPKEDQK